MGAIFIEKIYVSVLLFIFGCALGSFLNVLADRLSHEQSINGRSYCEKCQHTLSATDLIPILSFFILGKRCRYCKQPLSWYYPLSEIITGVAYVLTWIYAPVSTDIGRIIYVSIVSCLLVIFLADVKYQIIPDEMQIALFICTLLLFLLPGFTWALLAWKILAAVMIMLPILILFLVTKGRGMGFGDVKLALTIGFLHGIKNGLLVLYLAFVSGAVIGLALLLLQKRKLRSKIAFGPFLVFGIVIMLFFPSQILTILDKIYHI